MTDSVNRRDKTLEAKPIEVEIYETVDGRVPFSDCSDGSIYEMPITTKKYQTRYNSKNDN